MRKYWPQTTMSYWRTNDVRCTVVYHAPFPFFIGLGSFLEKTSLFSLTFFLNRASSIQLLEHTDIKSLTKKSQYSLLKAAAAHVFACVAHVYQIKSGYKARSPQRLNRTISSHLFLGKTPGPHSRLMSNHQLFELLVVRISRALPTLPSLTRVLPLAYLSLGCLPSSSMPWASRRLRRVLPAMLSHSSLHAVCDVTIYTMTFQKPWSGKTKPAE